MSELTVLLTMEERVRIVEEIQAGIARALGHSRPVPVIVGFEVGGVVYFQTNIDMADVERVLGIVGEQAQRMVKDWKRAMVMVETPGGKVN